MKVTGIGAKHSQPVQMTVWDYLQKDTAEQESYAEECEPGKMTETESTNTNQRQGGLLEQITSPENLKRACKQVKRNKGSSGIDGMAVEELPTWLETHEEELRKSLQEGEYRPQAVRRVEIPKENGKRRKLGIPTVVDRLVHQAINQVLTPLYEAQFSDKSYGFRPKRGAHDALKESQKNVTDGYKYVVDMDLEKYFDTVNQSKLIQVLSETIKDGRVISLIHKILRSGVLASGLFEASEEGVPQGSPLSPLLGNIMLNECDKELERRGHRFVRYADDMMIFCKSRKAAIRTLDKIVPYIEERLFLRINREKTKVAHVKDVKFLGYGFYIMRGTCLLRVPPESKKKLKDKLRKVTGRSNGMSVADRKEKLNQIVRGWVNYFCLAEMTRMLGEVDGWLRRRLRMVTWKRWKRVRTRFTNLQKAGIDKRKAWEWANTRLGYWRIAGSWILTRSIPDALLKKAGYLTLSGCYQAKRNV